MTNHPNRLTTCRPREHLRAAGIDYPQAWKQYDSFRADRGKGLPNWPDWCYCPMAAAYAIVSGGGNNRCDLGEVGDVARLTALAAWRPTQSIYRFDPALYASLIETPVGKLPVDVLYRLPEWCVYIETPGLHWLGGPLVGFFAHLEWDAASDGRPELRLLLDLDSPDGPTLLGQPIHLTADTLGECLAEAMREGRRQMIRLGETLAAANQPPDEVLAASIAGEAAQLLSLLLYLCSEAADYGGREPPAYPRPKKTKQGWRLFPPDLPRTWEVGVRIGSALRRAYLNQETAAEPETTETGRAKPRAHVRVAHWHTYLTGTGRVNRVLRWLPPIPINVGDPDDLPATIRAVKP